MKLHQIPAVIAIIPARYASMRFPGKPLAMIHGKTLIQRTYENTRRCPLIDRLIVATDDHRIYDHVKAFNGEVVMTPEDFPTGSDRLAYVVQKDQALQAAEVIVNVQGDEPCFEPEVLMQLIQILQNDDEAVMLTAAFKLEDEAEALNPNCVKCVIDRQGNALYFSRSLIPGNREKKFNQETTYYKHVGLYAFRPQFLLQYGKLPMTPLQCAESLEQLKVLEHGYKIKVAIVKSASVDVNTPEDLKKVEQQLCKQNSSSSLAESVHPSVKG